MLLLLLLLLPSHMLQGLYEDPTILFTGKFSLTELLLVLNADCCCYRCWHFVVCRACARTPPSFSLQPRTC
jgi:hypothetical protein